MLQVCRGDKDIDVEDGKGQVGKYRRWIMTVFPGRRQAHYGYMVAAKDGNVSEEAKVYNEMDALLK